MACVRSRDTTPEWIVRSVLHKLGYRYRIHDGRLPGKPDLVFPRKRVALFVHGCFWHRHTECRRGISLPVARQDYWIKKFEKTMMRDIRNRAELENAGWKVVIVWECQLKQPQWIEEVNDALAADHGRCTNSACR
jgi:DNA mismatch endonuclease (patch repair protein)